MLLLGVSAVAAPAQASTGVAGVSTSAVTAAAGDDGAANRSTRVVIEARDLAEGTVASTGTAAGRLEDGAAQSRDRLSGAVTDASASVQTTVSQVESAGTRVTGIAVGPRTTSGEQASPAGSPRPEAARDSTGGSKQRSHRRDRETDAEGPERAAVATSSRAQRTTADSRVAPSEGTVRAPSALSAHISGSDVSVPSPGQTAEGSSIASRSADASSAASLSAAVPLVAGEQRQVADAASQPLPTPSNGRPARAAWAPAPGSAAGSASFLLAFLLVAGMLRPSGLGQRLSPFSASAAPVLFLAALERPG